MANGKAWLGRTFGKYIFDETTVASVEALGPRFRKLTLEGDVVATTRWSAGDKVQVFVGDDGMRTYTPFDWDTTRSSVSLLVFVRDESAGSRLGRDTQVGDRVSYFGPRGSLALEATKGTVVLFGDETSFALASALARTNANARFVFEVDAVDEARAIADALRLSGVTFVARTASDAHHETIVASLADRIDAAPDATLVWSGRAKSIQHLRRMLAARDVRAKKHLAKAYWAEGRVGLD